MIRGFFSTDELIPHPYIEFRLEFPSQPHIVGYINFLFDTGSDTTILSPRHAKFIGLDLSDLELSGELGGIGGSVRSRIVEATLRAQGYVMTLNIHIPEDGEELPSILGRDFISAFTLVIRQRDGVALLLDDDEADALNLPV